MKIDLGLITRGLNAWNALSEMTVGEISIDQLQKVVSGGGFQMDAEVLTTVASLINEQMFEGSLGDFISNGGLFQLLAKMRQTSQGPTIIRCPHCENPIIL